MSCADDMLRLRFYRRQAHQNLVAAKHILEAARRVCSDYLRSNPPKTFRLQEAYRNPDGTYDKPHWDEVGAYMGHGFIDCEELDQHIIQEGEWTLVYEDETNDPRPGYRRVIDVTW